jgi:regulator of sirC expression with transglutaminase-like and TPR domain
VGDFDVPLGLFLQAAPARDVLARILRNLKEIHRSGEDWPRLLQVLNRLVVLLPDAWEERRDRGLAYAELGMTGEALHDLDLYLAHARAAEDQSAIRARVARLRSAGPRRLH